jgi:hypothetical protein
MHGTTKKITNYCVYQMLHGYMFRPISGHLQGILLIVVGKYPAIFLSLSHVSPISPLDINFKNITSLSSAPFSVYLKLDGK